MVRCLRLHLQRNFSGQNVLSAGHLVESSAIQWSMWVPSKLCGEAPQMLVRDVMESGRGLLRR